MIYKCLLTMACSGMLLACTGLEQRSSSTRTESRTRPPVIEARPCRADSFYIDVPLHNDPMWTRTTDLDPFAASLQAAANQPLLPWFCGSDALTCPVTPVSATVTSVLAPRSAAYRDDGHLRFFRVRFHDEAGTALSVRPAAQCEVVDWIRTGLETAGFDSDTFYVGRECDASVMSVEGAPSSEMLTWHLERMGLSSQAANVSAPPPSVQTVDLALVDSGVLPAVGTDPGGIGLAMSADFLPQNPGLHGHGTGLAVLTRQLAPHARLASLRALGAGGSGTSAQLAEALDEVLHGTSNTSPLILNLSLGWPSELGRSARITGPACLSYEDPFGEPVRYLLDTARRLDQTGERPVFVSAAAGNQPLPVPGTLFPPPAGPHAFECNGISPSGTPWFFPAEWDRVPSCRSAIPGITHVTLAVSVVDDRDLPAGNAIPGAESPLVAPGQHVYAAHPNAPATASQTTVQCGSTAAFPAPVTLPRAFTGSSVGAALVSAAAARAQATRLSLGLSPLDGKTLARVLYLTADRVGRLNASGAPVRRLNVARLDDTLASRQCQAVITCAASNGAPEQLPATLVEDCKYALADCGLERLDGAGNLITPQLRTWDPVSWTETYGSPVCTQEAEDTQFTAASSCAGLCPFEDGVGRNLLGSLGPQPHDPTCPDCKAVLNPPQNSFDLGLELSGQFPLGTSFSSPFLVLDDPTTNSKVYLDLSTLAESAAWAPGAYLELQGSLDGATGFDWSTTSAHLAIDVYQDGKLQGTDYSPLRYDYY